MATANSVIEQAWPGTVFSEHERALLCYLIEHERAVSRAELLEKVWGHRATQNTNTVEVTIRRLRVKIEPNPGRPTHVLTRRGRGYELVLPAHMVRPTDVDAVTQQVAVLLDGRPDVIGVATEATQAETTGVGGFVGRQSELAELEARVRGGSRLLTLLGGPGLGKTRLAHEFARQHATSFPGGVRFCDLSTARSLPEALSLIARALGVLRSGDDATTEAQLGVAIASRQGCLVVLDNVTQVSGELGVVVQGLQRSCPQATFLVTSRSRLGVEDEHLLTLHGLTEQAGVALLRERLTGGSGTPVDAEAMKKVCAAVAGVPLALELAAARARRLSLRLVAQELVVGGAAPSDSLRMAVGGSLEALGDDERHALVQLAVFEGGVQADVAESFLELKGDALDVLVALLDASLLWRTDMGGQIRFEVYQPVREFIRMQFVDELARAARRHAAWAHAWGRLHGHAARVSPASGLLLRREVQNLVAGHRWMLERRDPRALELIEDLGVLHRLGELGTYGVLLQATRVALVPAGSVGTRLHVLFAKSLRGSLARASAEIERGLAGAEPGSEHHVALLAESAHVAIARSEAQSALELTKAGLELCRGQDWGYLEVALSNHLGCAYQELGHRTEAIRTFRDALDRFEGAHETATLWTNLAAALGLAGELDEAEACFARAHAIAVRFGDATDQQAVHSGLAVHLARLGRFDEAHAQFTQLLDEGRRLGIVPSTSRLINAGIVALLAEQADGALQHLQTADRQLEGAPGPRPLTCRIYLLIALASADRRDAAEECDRAIEAAERGSWTDRARQEWALARGHVDLVNARAAVVSGRQDAAAVDLASAQARLRRVDSRAGDVALAVGLLKSALARHERFVEASKPGDTG